MGAALFGSPSDPGFLVPEYTRNSSPPGVVDNIPLPATHVHGSMAVNSGQKSHAGRQMYNKTCGCIILFSDPKHNKALEDMT